MGCGPQTITVQGFLENDQCDLPALPDIDTEYYILGCLQDDGTITLSQPTKS